MVDYIEMSTRQTLYCPTCDVPVPESDVDWVQLSAFCTDCEQEIVLSGYIEPPSPTADYREKVFQPLEIDRPRGLALEKSAIPGVESFRVGGKIAGIQLRLERDAVIFKGLFGRERRTPLDDLMGFGALQRVVVVMGDPDLTWFVGAIVTDGTMLRVWEYTERDHARYVASELNKSLLFIRSPSTPYRD